MKYIARRFIDFFRPGDEIPDGYYDAVTLNSLIAKRHIEAVNEPPAMVEPEKPAEPAAPQKVARGRNGKLRNGR
jgi:hypothetical protein